MAFNIRNFFRILGRKNDVQAVEKIEHSVAKPVEQWSETCAKRAANEPLQLPAPTAEQVLERMPKFDVGFRLGFSPKNLEVTQTVTKEGSHIRYFRQPKSDALVATVEQAGPKRLETVYGIAGEGNITKLEELGNNKFTITHQTDKTMQSYTQNPTFADGKMQNLSTSKFVYDDGFSRYSEVVTTGINGNIITKVEVRTVDKYKRPVNINVEIPGKATEREIRGEVQKKASTYYEHFLIEDNRVSDVLNYRKLMYDDLRNLLSNARK